MTQDPLTIILSYTISGDICIVGIRMRTASSVEKIEMDQLVSDRLRNMPRLNSMESFLGYAAGHQTVSLKSIKVKYLISAWKTRK